MGFGVFSKKKKKKLGDGSAQLENQDFGLEGKKTASRVCEEGGAWLVSPKAVEAERQDLPVPKFFSRMDQSRLADKWIFHSAFLSKLPRRITKKKNK